jgi:hypothetical protein
MYFNVKHKVEITGKLLLILVVALVSSGIQPFNSEPLNRTYQADIPPASGWNPAPGFGPYLGVNSMSMGYSLAKRDKAPPKSQTYQIIKINPNNPNLSDAINEPQPFPEKLEKLAVQGNLKSYYKELVKKEPIDYIQSKVFDSGELKKVRRILVKEFENKTNLLHRDDNAGKVVARHIYQQLRNDDEYAVISDPLAVKSDGFRMKVLSDPSLMSDGESYLEFPAKPISANPKINPNQVDAVMVGAVTKYRDSFIDENGNNQKSLASGIEFGSYLISAKSGKVLWGARYVSSQNPGFFEFFKNGGQWKSKKSLSRLATRNVLKVFNNDRSQK